MSGETILVNAFFSFWYSFGFYFMLIIGYVWLVGIVLILIHILTKK